MTMVRVAALAALLLAVPRGPAAAQTSAARALVTRTALETEVARQEQVAESPAYSGGRRARARQEAAVLRARLQDGDFQVGDRLWVQVENEPTLTDTFAVEDGRQITLPGIPGRLPLAGVLRSELEAHLTRRIGEFVRNPVVRARTMVRIAVLGGVNRPGYYSVGTESLIEEVLAQVGGPAGEARLTEMRIERGEEKMWEGDRLQQAITEGRTLDALSVQAGDRLFIPPRRGTSTETIIRIVTLSLTLPAAILGLIAIF